MTIRSVDDSPTQLFGLSTDTKPTGSQDGAYFLETDTGHFYRYDKVVGAWFAPSTDVNLQDQTSPVLITELNKVHNTTALSSAVALDDYTLDVDATAGFIDHAHITIASDDDTRYSIFHQVGAIAGNTVTLDRPMDFAYGSGVQVTAGTHEMSVDGSSTPVIYGVRTADTPTGLNMSVDITRLIFLCTTASAVDLSKFGDIAGGLTRGLLIRSVDGVYQNIFNVKTNGALAGIMYDWTPYAATNPTQGIDGFVARLTFAGQSKLGSVVRLGPGQDLQAVAQDPLQSLLSLQIVAEGHVVVG